MVISALYAGANSLFRAFAPLASFFTLTGAAIRCAAAVESGHKPESRDLAALGIGQVMQGSHHIGR